MNITITIEQVLARSASLGGEFSWVKMADFIFKPHDGV